MGSLTSTWFRNGECQPREGIDLGVCCMRDSLKSQNSYSSHGKSNAAPWLNDWGTCELIFSPSQACRPVSLGEGFARHSQIQQRQHLFALIMILILSLIPWIWLTSEKPASPVKIDSISETLPFNETRKSADTLEDNSLPSQQARHTHATLEIVGSLFGMFTGLRLSYASTR